MSDYQQQIIERLNTRFKPEHIHIHDESKKHHGHPGARAGGGHYRLTIVSAAFIGLNRITRHRMVYDSLSDLLHTQIHALSIQALSPDENKHFSVHKSFS